MADFCLAAFLLTDLLVADWSLLSACSRLFWSGKRAASWAFRLDMVSESALAFFSCCLIRSLRRSCSAVWQILFMAAVNSGSGLTCGLGRNWRPIGQERLLTCSFRTDRDFRLLTRLVSRETILFLSVLKPSSVF